MKIDCGTDSSVENMSPTNWLQYMSELQCDSGKPKQMKQKMGCVNVYTAKRRKREREKQK